MNEFLTHLRNDMASSALQRDFWQDRMNMLAEKIATCERENNVHTESGFSVNDNDMLDVLSTPAEAVSIEDFKLRQPALSPEATQWAQDFMAPVTQALTEAV